MNDSLKNNTRYLSALKCLENGISILPLQPMNKQPYYELLPTNDKGNRTWKPFEQKPATIEEVTTWFEKDPETNIGAFTGAVNKMMAFDIDFRNGGKETWEQIAKGREINTPTNLTPGGFHILFQIPACPMELKQSLKGIDVKNDGGYIVWPPSIYPTGKHYLHNISFEDAPLAPLPDWILELLQEKKDDSNIDEPVGNYEVSAVSELTWRGVFQKCQDRRDKYSSDSDFDMAIIMSLVNMKAGYETVEIAFKAMVPERFLYPTKFAKEWEKRPEKAKRYLKRSYDKAVARGDSAEFINNKRKARKYRAIVNNTPWSGRGMTNRKAALLAHITQFEKCCQEPWNLSARDGEILSKMGYATFARHTKNLIEMGWLVLAEKCNKIEREAAAYAFGEQFKDLHNGDTYRECDTDEGLAVSSPNTPPDPLTMRICVSDVQNEKALAMSPVFGNEQTDCLGQTDTYGVFERQCLGKSGEFVWLALKAGCKTQKEIVERTGLHRNTVHMRLKNFEELSIVFRIGKEYQLNTEFDFKKLGADWDTASIEQRRRLSIQSDREQNEELIQWLKIQRRNAPPLF